MRERRRAFRNGGPRWGVASGPRLGTGRGPLEPRLQIVEGGEGGAAGVGGKDSSSFVVLFLVCGGGLMSAVVFPGIATGREQRLLPAYSGYWFAVPRYVGIDL